MKTLLIFSILCAFFASSLAGQIQIDAMKTQKKNNISLVKNRCIPTDDGGILTLGTNDTLIKLNKSLNIEWKKNISNKIQDGNIDFITQTDDGGYFLVNTKYAKSKSYTISRLDRHFNLIWKKTPNFESDLITFFSVATTKKGEYILAGYNSDKQLNTTAYAAAFDAKGDLKWVYNQPAKYVDEDFSDILIDKDNNIVLTMCYRRSSIYHKSSNNGGILKLSPDGKKIWEWHHPLNTEVTFQHICENKKYGGYLITGSIDTKQSNLLAHFIYISPYGEVVWTKNMGTEFYVDDALQTISTNSGIYLTVEHKSKKEEYLYTPKEYLGETDIWLIASDYSGNLLWEKTYGTNNDDQGLGIFELSDSSYLLS
jgi:hypothetical protein